MRAIERYGSCAQPAYPFEVSRELEPHGEGTPHSRTAYFAARESFRTRFDEVAEITDPDFTFMEAVDIGVLHPRIVTTYGHEVYNASEGKTNRLRRFHEQLTESFPDRQSGREREQKLVIGTSVFSQVVSTVIHINPEIFLFTLQANTEARNNGTMTELDQLLQERKRQAIILGNDEIVTKSCPDNVLNVGIPIAQLSLGDLQRRRWAGMSIEERSEQAESFYFAAAVLAQLVNEDVGKALHPSNNFVSYTAKAPQGLECAPASQDFILPQPRQEMPYVAAPVETREQILLANSFRDRFTPDELVAIVAEALEPSVTPEYVAAKYELDEASLHSLIGSYKKQNHPQLA